MKIQQAISRMQPLACLVLGAAALYFFIVNVTQYFFVGDDAYISFRYALNLVEGYGLVWNPGEAVEGYTNFLWVLLIAGGMFLGVAPEAASTTLSIACAVLLLAALLYRFSLLHGIGNPWTWLPVLVLSLSASFTAWSTSGLETMLFAMLVFAGIQLFLHERESAKEVTLLSSIVFALATLTRPDGGIFMFVAGLFLLVDIVAGRRSFKSGVVWALPYVAIVGTHFVWRYFYYGYWLPNTFYAKVSGTWVEQGLGYLNLFGSHYGLYWFVPFIAVAVVLRRNYATSLFFAVVLMQLLYILYVGGDSFEFRFLIVIFPFLYWLIADGIALTFSSVGRAGLPRAGARLLALLAAAGLLWTTYWGSTHPFTYRFMLGNSPVSEIELYADSRAEQGRFLRELVDEGLLPQDLVIGVGGAGALPYFSRLVTVDRRGLNDEYIAHMPVAGRGRVAHEHNAPYDYLVKRQVVVFDLFNQLVFSDNSKILEDRDYQYENREVRIRAVEVKGQYLIFATFVSDEALREIFRGLPIVKPGGLAL